MTFSTTEFNICAEKISQSFSFRSLNAPPPAIDAFDFLP
jgi:hypothetical protein